MNVKVTVGCAMIIRVIEWACILFLFFVIIAPALSIPLSITCFVFTACDTIQAYGWAYIRISVCVCYVCIYSCDLPSFFLVSIWMAKKIMVLLGMFVLVKFTNDTQIYDLLLLLLLLVISKVVLLFVYLLFSPEIEFDCSQIICKFEIQLVSQIDYTCCRIRTKTTHLFQHVFSSLSRCLPLSGPISLPRLLRLVHIKIRSSSPSS